jgi:hypothetical protein
VTQVVERLPSKGEALSSNPSTTKKGEKKGKSVHVQNKMQFFFPKGFQSMVD